MCYTGNRAEGDGIGRSFEFTTCASLAMALGVADALSHVPDTFRSFELDTPDAATTTLVFDLRQYAYIYGFAATLPTLPLLFCSSMS